MPSKTKICTKCNIEKSISEFYKQSSGLYGVRSVCIECTLKQSKKYRDSHKDYYAMKMSEWRHKHNICKPMNESKNCSQYLGICIAENVLSKVFKDVIKMPNNNPGFDFICNKGYKIDVKSSCIRYTNNNKTYIKWEFTTRYNQIPDYFLCLAFNNREDLTPLHLWLIPNTLEQHKKHSIIIYNSMLQKWKEYEQPIEKVISCCNTL